MSQWFIMQHCHIDTPFCTTRKSHVTWNFALSVPYSEEIRRCILLFLRTLANIHTVNESSSGGKPYTQVPGMRPHLAACKPKCGILQIARYSALVHNLAIRPRPSASTWCGRQPVRRSDQGRYGVLPKSSPTPFQTFPANCRGLEKPQPKCRRCSRAFQHIVQDSKHILRRSEENHSVEHLLSQSDLVQTPLYVLGGPRNRHDKTESTGNLVSARTSPTPASLCRNSTGLLTSQTAWSKTHTSSLSTWNQDTCVGRPKIIMMVCTFQIKLHSPIRLLIHIDQTVKTITLEPEGGEMIIHITQI